MSKVSCIDYIYPLYMLILSYSFIQLLIRHFYGVPLHWFTSHFYTTTNIITPENG